MNTITAKWKRIFNRKQVEPAVDPELEKSPLVEGEVKPFDIPANDPFLAYIQRASGVVDVSELKLDSPTVRAMQAEGVRLVLPLVSQGELIGLINLGPRRSEQDYSSDDKRLLQNLATQAAPALRIAQLAQQQQAEARQRERLTGTAVAGDQEHCRQRNPTLAGWGLAAHWQPATEVSGDFYDFVNFQMDAWP